MKSAYSELMPQENHSNYRITCLVGLREGDMVSPANTQKHRRIVHLSIRGPHLIVVPTSVLKNWEMEFKKFLPGFKIIAYYGNVRERKERRHGWKAPNAFHVCITSYQLILTDQHIFRRMPWVYMILDEAHNIKNFKSQRWQDLFTFRPHRRLLLTGTPLQVRHISFQAENYSS
jgi:SNF2 family DNA or RNA helicase